VNFVTNLFFYMSFQRWNSRIVISYIQTW